MLTRTTLATGWSGRLTSPATDGADPRTADGFPATVPGSVHSDLLAAGLIPDPFDGDNEHSLRWIGDSDWTYSTTFARPAGDATHTELVFAGLDTVASIHVNGRHLASTENQHRTYRVALGDLDEQNSLEVRFLSPRREGAARRDAFGIRPTPFQDVNNVAPFLRKMACDFGWDWGPDLATSGIWRPVTLETWSTARISSVRPVTSVAGTTGTVRFEVALERDGSSPLSLTASVGGRAVEAAVVGSTATVVVELDDIERWWPAGLGAQRLYDVTVALRDERGGLDTWTSRVGFRELVVEQDEDADGAGAGFRFVVNGEPLFARGVNWIPDSSFIATVDRAQYCRRLTQARELGANIVRVWGGGSFESDDFYDTCDELGLLVWQDFLFACAAYPEEQPYLSEVEAEARDNIARIMPHPSLAIWNGNNECLWFWFLHDWEEVLGTTTWGEAYYFDLLPSLVAELDPQRPYIPGSPSSGSRDHEPNDPARGVVHQWIPGDYREYRATRPRFVSEFGFQGPPSRELFDAVVHEADPRPFSPGSVQRQKAAGGTERLEDVMGVHFGVPDDFDEWYWLGQLTQARAVGYGIEYFRSLAPWCSGTIVWQLNDCWPVLSWSMIDSAERWKPAAYAMRRAFADRVATLHLTDEGVRLAIGNETRETWDAIAVIERWSATERLSRQEIPVTALAHETVWTTVHDGEIALDELIVATVDGIRAVQLGGVDRDFPDAPAHFALTVREADGGVNVEVAASSLLRDVTIQPGSIDENSHCDRNLITLLPGESDVWHITTAHPELFSVPALQATVRTARAAVS